MDLTPIATPSPEPTLTGPEPPSASAPGGGSPRLRGLLAGAGAAVVLGLADAALTAWLGGRVTPSAWVVGFGVGLATRLGSGRRGSRTLQVAAPMLAYLALLAAHLPLLDAAARAELFATPRGLATFAALPLLVQAGDSFGLALMLLGLIQAGALNRPGRRR